ncbi:MAG: hypothetical protein ACFFF9_11545 [Candidatus Thorarchaeota archaeon]
MQKRLRVEVDVSDLTELAYYIDKRCNDFEKMLEANPKYAEYTVKRQHFGEDWQLDPYVIQNPQGEDLVYLEVWEMDTLSDSELVSYIEVQMNREKIDDSKGALPFAIGVICLLPSAIFFSIMEIISPSDQVISFPLGISLASVSVFLLLGGRFYKFRRDAMSKRHHIDVMAAKENLTFLHALRKLASSASNKESWKGDEYVKRLKHIEDEFSGVVS